MGQQGNLIKSQTFHGMGAASYISIYFFILFVIFSALTPTSAEKSYSYGVLLDAGSSGTRAYVYRWPDLSSTRYEVPELEQLGSGYKVEYGLSSFAHNNANFEEIEAYIKDLIDNAKKQVPERVRPVTSIYCMATAGMRLLVDEHADDVMEAVNDILEDESINPFRYDSQNTRILSGEEEGAFAWLTVNYLSGFFDTEDPDFAKSRGIVELGGASMQIAFVPDGSVLANKFPVYLGGKYYPLYVHSYLYYGQEYSLRFAREELVRQHGSATNIDHPCVLKGDYTTSINEVTIDGIKRKFTGTGNFTGCQKLLDSFLYQLKPYRCFPKPCGIGSTYQPNIEDSMTFYALGAFLYPLRAYGFGSNEDPTPKQVLDGAKRYCQMQFSEAKIQSGERDEYVSAMCLVGIYGADLFTDIFQFDEHTKQMKYVSKINGVKTSWTLGALLYETARQNDALVASVGEVQSGSTHLQLHRSYRESIVFFVLWLFVLVSTIS